MKKLTLLIALVAFGQSITSARADVRLPAIFSDNLVLQRDQKVTIWGWAAEGEEVTVKFADQEKRSAAGNGGKWSVQLDPMPADSTPSELSVAGKNTIVLKGVLVGEVWICSGQSNMAWPVSKSKNPEKEIAAADFPLIRQFAVARSTAAKPQEECTGKWSVTSPETAGAFTAVGYYFGRELYQKLKVPIGLINTSWGGTRSEAWTSREALVAEPAAEPILATWDRAIAAYDPAKAKAKHEVDLAKFNKWVAEAKAKGEKPPRGRPRLLPNPSLSRHAPSAIHNAMITPLVPYGIRGAIWYQGESNRQRAHQYRSIFPAMIRDWRKQFGQGDFPFYFVQLANFMAASTEPSTPDSWAELQEAQTLTLRKLENVGMAIANDIGNAKDIHPKNKQEVGRRLSLWALAGPYQQKQVRSGPIYRQFKIEGDKVHVSFDHVGSGLKARDGGELKRFEIAGEDRKFVWATATIDGDSVVVHSPAVSKPVAVRYAWAANPAGANLVNSAGLPASLFRTDNWPGVTAEVVEPPIGH